MHSFWARGMAVYYIVYTYVARGADQMPRCPDASHEHIRLSLMPAVFEAGMYGSLFGLSLAKEQLPCMRAKLPSTVHISTRQLLAHPP